MRIGGHTQRRPRPTIANDSGRDESRSLHGEQSRCHTLRHVSEERSASFTQQIRAKLNIKEESDEAGITLEEVERALSDVYGRSGVWKRS